MLTYLKSKKWSFSLNINQILANSCENLNVLTNSEVLDKYIKELLIKSIAIFFQKIKEPNNFYYILSVPMRAKMWKIFFKDWGLNSGLPACYINVLQLEPHSSPFFFSLLFR
jgi:hypothetical protein